MEKDLKIKSMEIVEITPEKAAEMLNKNKNNRPRSNTLVAHYSAAMTSGRWMLTHQGIAVDEQGNIIDGQHRLTAVITSGVTVEFPLTTYCGKVNTIGTMIDRGKNRTMTDITGVEKPKLAVINVVANLFAFGKYRTLFPDQYKSMVDRTRSEFEQVENVAGYSLSTTFSRGKDPIRGLLWNSCGKAVAVAGVLEGIDISLFCLSEERKSKSFRDYIDWSKEMLGSLTGNFIPTNCAMLWNVVKNKGFILPSEYKAIDKNKNELRDIFAQKYPEFME